VRYSAALGVDRGRTEGEQVYVFAEVRAEASAPQGELQSMVLEIVHAFHAQLGFRPGRVYLLKPRAIPMTHNGKIQHVRLKENYMNGSLRSENRILFPDY
jgi:acyl-coenzyme A synthetase/AMP-(fatty) acid ligase